MRHHDGTYRSTREAFAAERVGSIHGPYRAPMLARAWPTLARIVAVIVMFGALGALLGWWGKPL